MTQRQSAIVLTFLAALYVGALVFFAPQLGFLSGESEFSWAAGTAAGFVVASPAFLAIWAVHGQQRPTVRLPLTTWLCSVFFLAAVYGEVRYFGGGDADIVLLALIAWVTGYLANLLLLRLLRAVRGWRLQRIECQPSLAATIDSLSDDRARRKRQFTIRTLLVWTSAAAVLFAGLRWLAPYGTYDADELPAQFIEGVLIEGVVLSLIFVLATLPVVSFTLIVLADGRRTIWRCALAAITATGIACGAVMFQWWLGEQEADILTLALAIEGGVLTAAVAAASVTRACGYRLVRGRQAVQASVSGAPIELPRRRRQFAFALASLVMASLALACYAPMRFETWRRADERARWELLGWHADLDDEGRVTKLTSSGECDIEGTKSLVAQFSHLKSLQVSYPDDCDTLLAALPPLPELETLWLTEATDGGLARLDRCPNLETLTLVGDGITDVGLRHLRDLRNLKKLYLADTGVLLEDVPDIVQLEELNLQGTAVGDAGASHLDRFPNLKKLNLRRTNVRDRGLDGLRALKSLTSLNLQLTEVSDEGVVSLAELSRLKSLDLQLTAVSEGGLVELRQALPEAEIKAGANDAMIDNAIFGRVAMTTGGKTVIRRGSQIAMLKRLHARGNYPTRDENGDSEPITVTDEGLALLSGQTTMEELDLRESAVTDAGLTSLTALKSLKRLDLRGTQVTQQGCQRLAKTLPNCEIVR
jgi:Leucine-rich repeat (LRR) protein